MNKKIKWHRRGLNFPIKSLHIVFCAFSILASPATAQTTSPIQTINIGLIGGFTGGSGYASLVSTSGVLTSTTASTRSNVIESVAFNNSGLGLIGGIDSTGTNAFAAFVSYTGALTLLSTPATTNSVINSVAINDSGNGLIGGSQNSAASDYTALVSSSGAVTPISGSVGAAQIFSVAINNSGLGLIGGETGPGAGYAAFVSSTGTVTNLTGLVPTGRVLSAAINSSGNGLIGGHYTTNNNMYAASVTSSSTMASTLGGLPGMMNPNTYINSVAINDSGLGLIGGSNNSNQYAATVTAGTASSITLGGAGTINSVAINSSGEGLVGGALGANAYAAFISSGAASPIAGLSGSSINSVAINRFGQGLIGGNNSFAALVLADGTVTTLTLPAGTTINAVAWGQYILNTGIPTQGLHGNNLIFSTYINNNAMQNVFYFIPSILNGTLKDALEKAAPTRNGFSTYTESMNLFYLTTALSTHLKQQRSIHQRRSPATNPSTGEFSKKVESRLRTSLDRENLSLEGDAAVDNDTLAQTKEMSPQGEKSKRLCINELPQYTVWVEPIGAIAHEKAQRQTPAFRPLTGGGIAAFEARPFQDALFGGGAAYLYTHIHEEHDFGHANINQEVLFFYGSWDDTRWYADGFLFGGLYQVNQVRDIDITGFSFKSASKPHGWQFMPHVEFGYNYTQLDYPEDRFQWRLNPFAMIDWASNWQDDFKETGRGPFNVSQKSHYSSLLRTEVGIRFYESFLFDTWSLTLEEKGSYVNIPSFGAGQVTASLIGSPGLFTVETLSAPQNLGALQFLASFNPLQGYYYPITTIFYQLQFGKKYQSHQLDLGLSWGF